MDKKALKALIQEVIKENLDDSRAVLREPHVAAQLRKIFDKIRHRKPIEEDEINSLVITAFAAGRKNNHLPQDTHLKSHQFPSPYQKR